MPQWRWILKKLENRLLVRAVLFSLGGVLTALLGVYAAGVIPGSWAQLLDPQALENVLNILASSMLAVTAFSITAMVSAFGIVTNNATPRSTPLLIEDGVSQTALSTFLGAFIFSIVAIVALKVGSYGESGHLVLFAATLVVLFMVISTLIHWIEYLAGLARIARTVDKVEEVARRAIEARLKAPCLGCAPMPEDMARPQPHQQRICSEQVGYVQSIDVEAISKICDAFDLEIAIDAPPGNFVSPDRALARIVKGHCRDEEELERLRRAFFIADSRSFAQDPRFGMVVLSEIASKALSPGINDPGTAIDVLGTGQRLLTLWLGGERDPQAKIDHPRLYLPRIRLADMLGDLFAPIARDGAGIYEVALRLHKTLGSLHELAQEEENRKALRHQARLALKRFEAGPALEEEKARVREVALPASP